MSFDKLPHIPPNFEIIKPLNCFADIVVVVKQAVRAQKPSIPSSLINIDEYSLMLFMNLN